MRSPAIYAAINAVSTDLAQRGIPKNGFNTVADYRYRSIDDLIDGLAPYLAKHQLCVLPSVVERVVSERTDELGHAVVGVALRVAFNLVSAEDGSCHVIQVYGEALDGGDKATSKAMTAAYKSAMAQTFCIPVVGASDPDGVTHRLSSRRHEPEPVQGWQQWCEDIQDIVQVCETEQAIGIVQDRNRQLLAAISRERPELYAWLGQVFSDRRAQLQRRTVSKAEGQGAKRRISRKAGRPKRTTVKEGPVTQVDLQHA